MTRIQRLLVLTVVALTPGAGSFAQAQEVHGSVTAFDGQTLSVKSDEDGRIVQAQIARGAEVSFSDGGDRRNFPNPSVQDLQPGMGVRFAPGNPVNRVTVVYVPAGMGRGHAAVATPPPTAAPEKLKARIERIDFGRRELQVDVAGRRRTFRLESASQASGFHEGDLVTLTVQGDSVTRIDPAEQRGVVTRIDDRRGSITIEVNRRDETYSIDRRDLQGVRQGDRVRFDVEERSGGQRVIVRLQRD